MSISKGDKLPAGQLLKPGANGPAPLDAADLAQGRTPRHDLSAFALARLAPGRRLAPGTAI